MRYLPPGRRPAVLLRLHTADHIRRASPVQEAQGTRAAGDWARIMRFAVYEQEYPVALVFAHRRQGMFSALLQHPVSSSRCALAPHGRTSVVLLR